MENTILSNIKSVRQTAKSLPEQVAEQIRQLIIDQHLGIGEKLPNEFELAQQLNVGRGSVREAVKLLVARNVLEIQRGRGTYIANNTGLVDDPFGLAYLGDELRLFQELFQLRMRLEPWIAGLAAEHAAKENLDELREWQHKVEELIQAEEDHLSADQQFHACIANCSQNRVLPLLIPVITYSVHLFSKMNQRTLGQETIETHARVVDAIVAHDSERAQSEMIEHLRMNWKSVFPLYDFSDKTISS